jgi:glyoxylase-like metal-dependent hydrolase (beta-lactamase superfamily II)
MLQPLRIRAFNPGPMTGQGNNTYLLSGAKGGATLIDAGIGAPRHLAEIESHLVPRGVALELVLVTHADHDHAAGVASLAARHPGVRFAKFPWPGEDEKYPVVWRPLTDDERIEAAGETLRVLHTPGHSPDHVSFWHEPSATAFTGDLVVPGGSVVIQWSRGGRLEPYLESLRRVLALRPQSLFPAHGEHVVNPMALLASYLEHRTERERQVVAALESGYDTVRAIAECIYDRIDAALMPAAQENVRAHLEKLKDEGRTSEDHGRWRLQGVNRT